MIPMVGTVKVASKRWSGTQPDKGDTIVDADRTNPLLDNPFPMRDKSLAERERVIATNNLRVDADIAVGGPISQELMRLAQLVLGDAEITLSCWCAPCACHADRYVKEIQKLICEQRQRGASKHCLL